MSTVFVGRQPIYSATMETVAYELLFRSDEKNRASFVDGEQATAQLVLNTFAEIGLEQIVGKLPAFVNIPENFILSGHVFALPKELVVLEVLENVRPTPRVLEALRTLRDNGYRIAIDDFTCSPELMPLVELAEIVKVDLPAIPRQELSGHVETLRRYDCQILAEKIESQEEFEYCRDLGFELFQGYFLCRPSIVSGKQLPINRVALMRLITRLQCPTVTLTDIADVIQTEPTLSYKLLRFVNSAYCGFTTKIESVAHAVTVAGIRRVKALSCLSLLTKAAEDKPQQFVQTVLTRARMAELLAEQLRQVRTDTYFLVGLFSALDALLGVPMEEALEVVPVSREVKEALIHRKGVFGMVLDCVVAYERGDWDNVVCHTLTPTSIRSAYLQAINWANERTKDAYLEPASA